MTTAKKSAAKKTPASRTKAKSSPAREKSNPCWPGFEPVPGKKPQTKGSCKRTPGPHTKATRHATQKAAAASKLSKS